VPHIIVVRMSRQALTPEEFLKEVDNLMWRITHPRGTKVKQVNVYYNNQVFVVRPSGVEKYEWVKMKTNEGQLIEDGTVLISPNQMIRLFKLRQKLFKMIRVEDELSGGHHKSYEGRLELTLELPAVWYETKDHEWHLHLACYLLCAGRSETWSGKTLDGVIDKFENWLSGTNVADGVIWDGGNGE